jgi:hypothetical protein
MKRLLLIFFLLTAGIFAQQQPYDVDTLLIAQGATTSSWKDLDNRRLAAVVFDTTGAYGYEGGYYFNFTKFTFQPGLITSGFSTDSLAYGFNAVSVDSSGDRKTRYWVADTTQKMMLFDPKDTYPFRWIRIGVNAAPDTSVIVYIISVTL